MQFTEILNKIEEITTYNSFKHVISKLVYDDFCITKDEMKNQNIFKTIDYNELLFLMGLWIKNVDRLKVFPKEHIEANAILVRKLLDDLHNSLSDIKKVDVDKGIKDTINYKELFFYSPTHAYDIQYANLVYYKYANDYDWIKKTTGLRIDGFQKIFFEIKRTIIYRLKDNNFINNTKRKCKFTNIFTFDKKRDKPFFKIKGIEHFLNYFSLSYNEIAKTELSDISDYNICREKPIIKLGEDSYFIPSAFHLAEAMWENFFYKMKDTDYSSKAFQNRGAFAENIVYTFLKSCFSNVYKNVVLYKNKSIQITDIDVCVTHNKTMVIFMVKSKKLRLLSRKGNILDVYNDYENAILDSFKQGKIAKSSILKKECIIRNNPELQEHLGNVNEIFIFTVVLDDYPFLNFQNHLFHEKSSDIPISISIFDLEVILNYMEGSDDFINYTKMRAELSKKINMGSEMSFLELYRTNRNVNFSGYDLVYLENDWAKSIDADFYDRLLTGKIKTFINNN